MLIKGLIPFVWRNSETGDLTSVGQSETVTINDTIGGNLVSEGLAEAIESASET